MDPNDRFQSQSLDDRAQRQVYLVTYSRANLEKFPSRESFALTVVHAFALGSKISVMQWACCREPHKEIGLHYHLVLKLSTKKRWLSVKNQLMEHNGIVLHFSDGHDDYWDAYDYVTKEDDQFITSNDHPEKPVRPSQTKKAIAAHRKKRREGDGQVPCSSKSTSADPPAKRTRHRNSRRNALRPLDVQVLICDRGMNSPDELLALGEEQRVQGQRDLADFCAGKTSAQLESIFEQAWRARNAKAKIAKKKRNRMDVIRLAAIQACSPECNGRWLELALDLLHKNHIHEVIFADAVRTLLIAGRSKFNNLMILGESNTAKSFILQPLDVLFDCFLNPAADKYAWVGVNDKECILMQDFEFTEKLITWKSFLLLLEGAKLHLPAPKNQQAKDEFFVTDIPVFATSGVKIEKVDRANRLDIMATDMMDSRWKYITFTHIFSKHEQVVTPPCGVCFAKLVLTGEL